jgi:hypothetical protein
MAFESVASLVRISASLSNLGFIHLDLALSSLVDLTRCQPHMGVREDRVLFGSELHMANWHWFAGTSAEVVGYDSPLARNRNIPSSQVLTRIACCPSPSCRPLYNYPERCPLRLGWSRRR